MKDIESVIFEILHNENSIPQDLLFKKLAFMRAENARLLHEKLIQFQEMGP